MTTENPQVGAVPGSPNTTTGAGMIYSLIPKVMQTVGAVPKLGKMTMGGSRGSYPYHKIEDILDHVQEALIAHGVFYMVEVLSKDIRERITNYDVKMKVVELRVRYTFYASDGSSLSSIIESEGEDAGDKATAKAMTIALKTLLLQILAIPTEDMIDGDNERTEFTRHAGERTGNLKAVESKQGNKQPSGKSAPAAAAAQAEPAGEQKGASNPPPEMDELPTDVQVEAALTKARGPFNIQTEADEREAVVTYLHYKVGKTWLELDRTERRALLVKLREEADRRRQAKQAEKSSGDQRSSSKTSTKQPSAPPR